MKLTPEALLELPVGKYDITRNPYITSPDVEETHGLEVKINNDGERVYGIYDRFGRSFSLYPETDNEDGHLVIHAYITVCGSAFHITDQSRYDLRKYEIKSQTNL